MNQALPEKRQRTDSHGIDQEALNEIRSGLISASTGTFIYNIPEIVYGLEGSERCFALVLARFFYGVVWAVVVRRLNDLFAISHTSRKAAASP